MIENGRISIENEADIKQDLELLIEPLASFVKFYPEFLDLDKCYDKQPFFMLLAHYLVMRGFTQEIGIFSQNGQVSSSSIDGVSVSYQSSPYSSDELTYFLSLTPYGMAYLAWLRRQAGLRIIN